MIILQFIHDVLINSRTHAFLKDLLKISKHSLKKILKIYFFGITYFVVYFEDNYIDLFNPFFRDHLKMFYFNIVEPFKKE